MIFREENDFFSFMKNIPRAFVGVFQRRKGEDSMPGRPDVTLACWQVSGQKLGRQVWRASRRPLGLISLG